MVTGASGVVGEAVVRALVGRDEVRATVRRAEAAEPLRALGAKVAVRALEAADELAEILPRVHTLVHLVGGPHQVDDEGVLGANFTSTLVAIAAARDAGVARFALVSVPGADPEAADPYRRAKGLAEEAVAASGLEYAIVRAAPVYGLGGLWFTAVVQGTLADPPVVIGDPARPVAPVFADDLGAVIAAIDDRGEPVHGTWVLEGPDVVRAEELVGLLRADAGSPRPMQGPDVASQLEALLGLRLCAAAVHDLTTAGRAIDAPDAAAAFGVSRTPLLEGLRAVAERAGAGVGPQ